MEFLTPVGNLKTKGLMQMPSCQQKWHPERAMESRSAVGREKNEKEDQWDHGASEGHRICEKQED